MRTIIVLAACFTVMLFSCRKVENCQPATLEGYVKHHALFIPSGRVFIKKGTTEFPGSDTNSYDIKVQADASAHYSVSNLVQGNYYVYGYGYDSTISEAVKGGFPLIISCNSEAKTCTSDVPVVE